MKTKKIILALIVLLCLGNSSVRAVDFVGTRVVTTAGQVDVIDWFSTPGPENYLLQIVLEKVDPSKVEVGANLLNVSRHYPNGYPLGYIYSLFAPCFLPGPCVIFATGGRIDYYVNYISWPWLYKNGEPWIQLSADDSGVLTADAGDVIEVEIDDRLPATWIEVDDVEIGSQKHLYSLTGYEGHVKINTLDGYFSNPINTKSFTLNITTPPPTQYTISVSSNNTAYGTVSGGGTKDEGSNATVVASATTGNRFINWTENGNEVSTNASYAFGVTGNRTLVANFEAIPPTQYTISASSNNTAYGTVSGGGTFNKGATATLTAAATTGYRFVNWTENGNEVSTNASYAFGVTGNRTLVANFEAIPPTQYTISVTNSDTNQGTVSGGGTYNEGTSITLEAAAKSGYAFKNWTKGGAEVSTEASYQVTVSENASYVANFEAAIYTVSVLSGNTDHGTVSGGGTFNEGAATTVTATAKTGYRFVNWIEWASSEEASTEAVYTFTATKNVQLIAYFEAIPLKQYTISVLSNNADYGTVTGDGTFKEGAEVTIVAEAKSEYRFAHWTKNGDIVSTEAAYTFEVAEDVSYMANFERKIAVDEVSANDAPQLRCRVSDGVLSVIPASAGVVTVYTSAGSIVVAIAAQEGEAVEIALPMRGLYIVKTAAGTAKVVW